MKLIQKNTTSPFKLARSIVSQGGEGGAYETGGYDPNEYDRSGEIMTASIQSIGNVVGSALGSITKGDINKSRIKDNKRREKRISNIENKLEKETTRFTDQGKQKVGTKKSKKLEERKQKIQGRVDKTAKKIDEYESVYGKNTSNDLLKEERKKSGYGF